MGVGVDVWVGVCVCVDVGVDVGVNVGVNVGVEVFVGGRVCVGVLVDCGVAEPVSVGVGVGVSVGVGVGTWIFNLIVISAEEILFPSMKSFSETVPDGISVKSQTTISWGSLFCSVDRANSIQLPEPSIR